MRKYVFAFFALVIAFILSVILHEFLEGGHSTLSVISGFAVALVFAELIKREII